MCFKSEMYDSTWLEDSCWNNYFSYIVAGVSFVWESELIEWPVRPEKTKSRHLCLSAPIQETKISTTMFKNRGPSYEKTLFSLCPTSCYPLVSYLTSDSSIDVAFTASLRSSAIWPIQFKNLFLMSSLNISFLSLRSLILVLHLLRLWIISCIWFPLLYWRHETENKKDSKKRGKKVSLV